MEQGIKTKKALDSTAYKVIALLVLILALLLWMNSLFSSKALNARIGWITADDEHNLWITLPDQMLVVGANGELRHSHSTANLGISNTIADMVFTRPGQFWLRDLAGDIFRCTLDQLPCTPLNIATRSKPTYAKLSVAPDRSVVTLTDNNDGLVYILDPSGKVIGQSEATLNHPNVALFTKDGFVQADTGNFRLLRWPYVANSWRPDFSQSAVTVFKTIDDAIPANQANMQQLNTLLSSQPYAIEHMTDESWWILEGSMVLKNGTLNKYSQDGKDVSPIEFPVRDPVALARLDANTLIVAAREHARLARVEYRTSQLYSTPLLNTDEFGNSGVRNILAAVDKSRDRFAALASACKYAVGLLPLIAIFWFRSAGYDLNARL